MMMLLNISTLFFLRSTLLFIYATFIYVSFSHCFIFFVLITHHLLKSWEADAALLLLLLYLPAPGDTNHLSTIRISTTTTTQYLIVNIVVKMTIPNPTMSLFSSHLVKHWASS
jgi:hypothetical protein